MIRIVWLLSLLPDSRKLSCANLRRVSTFPSQLDSLSCSLTRARWDSLQWLLTTTSSTTFSCWTWDTFWRQFSPIWTSRHWQLWRWCHHSGGGWFIQAILYTGARSWFDQFLQIIICLQVQFILRLFEIPSRDLSRLRCPGPRTYHQCDQYCDCDSLHSNDFSKRLN